FVLARGAVVEGRVSTAEGEPVAGARVRVVESVGFSDAEGIYRLEGVPTGRQALVAGHLEFERRVTLIEVEPGLNVADVVLRGGWPVTGRVIEEDGTPVDGARVELLLDGAGEMRRYQTVSDADGALSFPRVVDGTFVVLAAKDGYGAVEIERGLRVDGGPVAELEVVLTSATALTGRLLGLELEELATAAVEAEQSERTRRTGTVDYDDGYEIRDLGPGVWLVKARVRDGSREAQARILIEPGVERVEKDLEFGRGITIRGSVSFRGVPLPETSVTFSGHDVAVRRTVMTDHEGAFRVSNLEPGRYRLGLANHREHLLYNEDVALDGDRELHVDIPTAWVSGRVISATTSQPL
ncbi:MAG: carboxypeptidase regulatory-like domain-containing protein, partial [bacterium]|nr:carboxypeptidase regulatory-like domain-containing protein [bacterium]